MKKRLLFGCMILALLMVSCKSTPKEDTTATENTDTVESTDQTQPTEVVEAVDMDSLLAQTGEARGKAEDAGAKNLYGADFDNADAKYEDLKNRAANGEDVSAEIKDLTARYQALEMAAKASKLKERIEHLDLAADGSADYDKGNAAMDKFNSELSTADGKTLLATATEAYNAYYAVCYDSFKRMADDERKAAVEQKKLADSVKAGVARKDEYKKAAATLVAGDSCYVTSNPEGAYNNYQEAKVSFTALYTDVSEKRAAAQKAIDDAKKKVQESSDYAAATDETNPLGDEAVEGIDESDTTLLEDDKFENPDDAVIKIEDEDTLKEKAGK